jgi:hypothetical protein
MPQSLVCDIHCDHSKKMVVVPRANEKGTIFEEIAILGSQMAVQKEIYAGQSRDFDKPP